MSSPPYSKEYDEKIPHHFYLAPLVFCGVELFDYPHYYEVDNFIWDEELLGVSFFKPSLTTYSFVILSSMYFDKKNILAKVGCLG
jgi:hypothetical protein